MVPVYTVWSAPYAAQSNVCKSPVWETWKRLAIERIFEEFRTRLAKNTAFGNKHIAGEGPELDVLDTAADELAAISGAELNVKYLLRKVMAS